MSKYYMDTWLAKKKQIVTTFHVVVLKPYMCIYLYERVCIILISLDKRFHNRSECFIFENEI